MPHVYASLGLVASWFRLPAIPPPTSRTYRSFALLAHLPRAYRRSLDQEKFLKIRVNVPSKALNTTSGWLFLQLLLAQVAQLAFKTGELHMIVREIERSTREAGTDDFVTMQTCLRSVACACIFTDAVSKPPAGQAA